MFSSPSQKGAKQASAKTPSHWSRALGVLSSLKKPPPPRAVEAGTNDTSVMNGDLSAVTEEGFQGGSAARSTGMNNTYSSDTEHFMSPMSPNFSPGKASSGMSMTNNSNATGGAQRSRLNLSALSSRTSNAKPSPAAGGAPTGNQLALAGGGDQMTLHGAKSPWQARQSSANFAVNLTGKSPWKGSRKISKSTKSATKPLTFLSNNSSERARRYRPNSVGLMGARSLGRYRRTGQFNHERVSQALVSLKDSFVAQAEQSASSSVFAIKGKVQWGSSSRPSRLPKPSQKRQRPIQDTQVEDVDEESEEDREGTSRKRRKKVSFDQEAEDDSAAVVTRVSATPSFKSVAQRKGTPMPSKSNQSAQAPAPSGVMFASPVNDAEDDESMSSRPSMQERLPQAPPRLDFSAIMSKLDSDETITLDFSSAKRESFDPVNLDPTANDLQLGWKKQVHISSSAARSFTEKADYEASRYERPASPVRERKKSRTVDDDGTSEQSVKRMKTSQNQEEEQIPDWICTENDCNTSNPHDESNCMKCGSLRKSENGKTGWGDTFAKYMNPNEWVCNDCLVRNDNVLTKCASCEAPRQGAKSENKAEEKNTPAKTTFAAAPASEGKYTFGTGTATLPVPTGKPDENKFAFPAPIATGGSSIGANGFTFGGTSSATPAPSAPAPAPGTGFTFTPTAPAPATGGFVFSANKSTVDNDTKTEDTGKPKITFGTTPSASTPAPPPSTGRFQYGSAQPKGTSDMTTSAAPAPATEVKKSKDTSGSSSSLSATAKPFDFKAPSGENGDKKPAEPNEFVFGKPGASDSTGNSASGASNGGFSFSSATAPPVSFGTSDSAEEQKSSADSNVASNFQFGNTTPGVQFGGPSAAKEQAAASTPATGAGFSFVGSDAATAQKVGNGGTAAPFGSTQVPPATVQSEKKTKRGRGYDLNGTKSAGPKPTSQAAPTLFGGPASAAPTQQAFKFGAPALDNAAGSNSGMGSTPAAPFANSAPTPASGGLQFGSAKAPAPSTSNSFTFGSSQAPAPAAPNAFGSSNVPAPAPMFGTAPGAPAPGMPAFGGVPVPAANFGQTTAAAPAPISFGSTPAAPAAPTMNFGSSTQAPAATFGSAPAAPAFGAAASGFGSSKPPASTPGVPAFGTGPNPPSTGFGGAAPFGSQTPAAPSQGFNGSSFGGNPTPGFGSTPAPGGGFGSNNFGAPNTGGFQSTPAPSGLGGGGFGANMPQTAPQGAPSFSMGTSGPPKRGRRVIRAKRPSRA